MMAMRGPATGRTRPLVVNSTKAVVMYAALSTSVAADIAVARLTTSTTTAIRPAAIVASAKLTYAGEIAQRKPFEDRVEGKRLKDDARHGTGVPARYQDVVTRARELPANKDEAISKPLRVRLQRACQLVPRDARKSTPIDSVIDPEPRAGGKGKVSTRGQSARGSSGERRARAAARIDVARSGAAMHTIRIRIGVHEPEE